MSVRTTNRGWRNEQSTNIDHKHWTRPYIRNAITKGKVTAYNAWNMVLDKSGLGNDTSRDWKQDALLVADGGSITQTPAYHRRGHVRDLGQDQLHRQDRRQAGTVLHAGQRMGHKYK
jgi:hypothetical protein